MGAPINDPSARVIATGISKASGRSFNIAVAFEPSASAGPAIAESTFHHFADYSGILPPVARASFRRCLGMVLPARPSRARPSIAMFGTSPCGSPVEWSIDLILAPRRS